MKRNFGYLFFILFFILFTGCHRGGGDSGVGSSDVGTGTGDSGAGSGADTSVVDSDSTITKVKIVSPDTVTYPVEFSVNIEIVNAVNTAGLYFRLKYDSNIVQLKNKNNLASSVKEGTFFNQGGVATSLGIGFIDQDPDSGCLLVGLSRSRENPGISGSGTVMTFTFITVNKGSTSIIFSEIAEENSLFAPETPLESITGVLWKNAEITVK